MGLIQGIGTRFISTSIVIRYSVVGLMCLLELRRYVNMRVCRVLDGGGEG